MNVLNRVWLYWYRKPPALFAAIVIFGLFMLAFVSDQVLAMKELPPAKVAESGMITEADGKQHYVYVIPPDPSLHAAYEESFAFRVRIGQRLAWGNVLLSMCACSFLALYFRTARMTLRVLWVKERSEEIIQQSTAKHPSLRKWKERTVVGLGLSGLMMALAVAVLWVVIVWLGWRGALESVAGRAQIVTLSSIAAKTALGSGICSLVFWIVTEWAAKRTATLTKDEG